MTFPRASLSLAALLLLPLACDSGAQAKSESGAAKQAEAPPDAAKQAEKPEQAEQAKAPDHELTPEELALIEQDPKELGPEQNRKRAYALRKKIMQDPDSPAAQALEETRRAVLAGELQLPGQEGKPQDNGVVIPAPDYLKNQDQSVGKPDQ